jgi:LysM repeat protein
MGSIRRSNWKQIVPYLVLNVIVSAVTIGIILLLVNRSPAVEETLPTATIDIAARVASAVPSATSTLAPSPTPNTYTIETGDTLFALAQEMGIVLEDLMAANGITDPSALDVGQVLIVPQIEGLTPIARETDVENTPEPTVEAPLVEIRGLEGSGDLEQEAVRLLNSGGVAAMAGWMLDDGDGNQYVFPAFTLHQGAVSVHTRAGQDTVIDLYWGEPEAVWTSGKLITLRNAAGVAQSTFRVPEN